MSGMSLSDLYEAQIEAQYFFYLTFGALTTCLCLTMLVCARIVAEAISRQVVLSETQPQARSIEKPVYDVEASLNYWLNRKEDVAYGSFPQEFSRPAERSFPQKVPIIWTPQSRHGCGYAERPKDAWRSLGRPIYLAQH